MHHGTQELPVIQKVYDLIKWYVPLLNKLPRSHRFGLGDRMIAQLYEMLEGLVQARYLTKNRAYRLWELFFQIFPRIIIPSLIAYHLYPASMPHCTQVSIILRVFPIGRSYWVKAANGFQCPKPSS